MTQPAVRAGTPAHLLSHWRRPVMALGALLLAGCALFGGEEKAAAAGERPEGAEVASEIEARITEKPNYDLIIEAPKPVPELVRTNTLLGRWQFRSDYVPGQLEIFARRAPDEIRQLLTTEGWFRPDIRIEQSDASATLKIDTGPQVKVTAVDLSFEGAIAAPEFERVRRRLQADWSLGVGSGFTQSAWNAAKSAIVARIRNDTFPKAKVTVSEAEVLPESGEVTLRVSVDSGPVVRFDGTEVTGLERYDPRIVLNLRPYQRGDVYSLEKLLTYQQRLRETRYFRTVTVLPDLERLEKQPENDTLQIRVAVVEEQSRRLTLGAGFSSDRGLRGQIGWTDRNLFGRGWVFDSSLLVDQISALASAGLKTPRNGNGNYFGAGLNLSRELVQGIRNEVGQVYFGYGRQREDTEWFASLAWQYDRETVFDGINPAYSTNARAFVPSLSWSTYQFDDRTYPTRGYGINAQAGFALEKLGATRTFTRFYLRAARFFPLADEGFFRGARLVFTGEAGVVTASSRDGIPSVNLFRTGGANSVRGYAFQSLGLKRGGAVLGARHVVVGSVEYQHPITDLIAGALFYDRGGAYEETVDFATVAGYGLGVRVRTPVGPINVDVAYGEADRRVRLHFSIGYTF